MLTSSALIPELNAFYFDGEVATACNGTLALQTPCALPITGGVEGKLLLSLLASSKADQVVCTPSSTDVLFSIGRTRARCPLFSAASLSFSAPKRVGAKLPVDEALQAGLELALQSAADIILESSRCGVTIAFDANALLLYSTDELTIVRVKLPSSVPGLSGLSGAYILPDNFCRLALKMRAKFLLFTKSGSIMASSSVGRLFGQLHHGAVPEQFAKVFDGLPKDGSRAALVPALRASLERACATSSDLSTFAYKDGVLTITTSARGCEVVDKVKLDLGATSLSVKTKPSYLLRCYDSVDWIELHKQCFVLGKGKGRASVLVSVQEVEQ